MKINDKQSKWLRLLHKCSELRMIKLDKHELLVLDDTINRKEYNTYTRPALNKLRARYILSDLNQMLIDHKSRWGKFTTGGSSFQYNSKMVIGTSSGIHPTHNQYYIRKPQRVGKPIVTGTSGGGFNADWYQKQWQHFDQFPIEMKDLRPNSKKDEEKFSIL
jgi:hypothetical protein